jgi:NAD(P)-dependent dehydrogenase (short-subunit alcohol dehydrogenase family)
MEGKTALVTGGGSGIGRSICLRLATEGARVLVLDRDADTATATAEAIRKSGGSTRDYACDVSNHARVAEVIGKMLDEGDVDILVNSAGVAHIGNVETTSEADLDRLYSVNVKGAYNLLAALIPAMKVRRHGVIVNIASVAATVAVGERFA